MANKVPYIALLLLCCSFSVSAGKPENRKSTFAQKDIFQSAVFLANNGIINDRNNEHIRFYANQGNMHVYFTERGLIYRIGDLDKRKLDEQKKEEKKGKDLDAEGIPLTMSTVAMDWVGANPHPQIVPGESANGYHTYLKKVDTGYTTITTSGYETLTYQDVYPGIDVVYSFPDNGGVKYNLIVKPGADPGLIKMKYSGAVRKIKQDNDGSVTIATPSGDIVEHPPVSYTDDHIPVASSLSIAGNTLHFDITGAYDPAQTLTIDPWVTVLTVLVVRNLGVSVDFDLAGDLYVYGAGSATPSDLTNYQKVAKFDPNGNFLWVFDGSVASIGWNTIGGAADYLSNAKVDEVTGKVYVGVGYNYVGTQLIRITSAGVYDNFESPQNSDFTEIWSFINNCATGSILALGGGTTYYLNMGVVNPTTAALSTSNFTRITGTYLQDIVSGAYDALGNLYVVMASNGTPSINNTMFRVNATYNNYIWNVPTGYTSFLEANNLPAFDYYSDNSNNFNALAANSAYLYYYDGYNLAAYNLANGSQVGTPTSISGYTALSQGGIAVDNCNHIYLGGQGVIKTFTFNGSTFSPGADISLGAGFTGDTVNDVRYNASSNLLYVAGSQITGTYTATLSTTCIMDTNTFTTMLIPACQQAIVKVTPGVGLTNPSFSFLWEDSAGNVLRQTTPNTNLNDTLTGIGTGHYTVQIQLNVNCGGSAQVDSFAIVCSTLVVLPDTSVCSGQPVTLTASPSVPGGRYLWSPGGATTQSITVSPITTTTYTATYTPTSGPVLTGTATVTVLHPPTVSVSDTSVCPGNAATLTATPSQAGGAYSWSPGGATTPSITVSPASSSTYTVVYTLGTCGTATDSGTVTISAAPAVSVANDTICQGSGGSLTATSSPAGGTYSWSPGGATTPSINVNPTSNTVYTVTYTVAGCGTAIDSGSVIISPPPSVSVPDDTTCLGSSSTLTADPSVSGGSYSWSPGGATTQSITVSLTSAATYTVLYTMPGCTPATASGTAVIIQPPTVSVNDTTTCQGTATSLTATPSLPGGTYSWSPGGAVTQTITVTPASLTTYTVSYLMPGCIASTASGTVDVTLPPIVTIGNDSTCLGQSVTLTATPSIPGGTYDWSPGGAVTQAITVSPLSSTTYTVSYVIPSSVCGPVIDSASVAVFPPPTLSVNSSLICAGTSATLTVSPSVAGGSYDWSPGGALTQSITVSPTSSTTYTVAYTYANCSVVTDSGRVTVAPLPSVTLSIINAICTSADGEAITDVSSGTAPFTYLWNDPYSTTTPTLAGLVANASYSVTVTDVNHCTAAAPGMIGDSITPLPVSDSLVQISCYGLQNGYISISIPDCNGCTYEWSNGASGTSMSDLPAGSYSVSVTDHNGCTSSASYIINEPAMASLTISPSDTTVIEDSFVRFNPLFGPYPTSSIVSYSWSPPGGLSCTDCPAPIFDSVSGYYSYALVITYNNTCQVSDTINVIVVSQHIIYVPNAFTPNGDGIDDVFQVFPRGGIRQIDLKIFDRWGEKVFESLDQGRGWDGTYRGQMETPGVFVYVLDLTFDDNFSLSKKGSITLIR